MAIKKIEKNQPAASMPVENMEVIYQECLVDLTESIIHPNIILSIGVDHFQKPIPICTAGEFSCIVAPSKTKKSFFKSLLCASYIGGKANILSPHITGHRKEDHYIVDIDTEQGKYYAQRTFKRTERITGEPYGYYLPLYTRKLTPQQRVDFIDWVLHKSEHAGKIKLAFIDGVADLLDDANNLVMSNNIAGCLLKWTDELGIHICTVIHKTFGNDKATGHLGSAVTKKAETIIYIDPLTGPDGKIFNYNTVKVRCGHSRGKMFEPFHMSVNLDGLPYTHTEEADHGNYWNTKPSTTDVVPEPPPPPGGSVSDAFGTNPDEDKKAENFDINF